VAIEGSKAYLLIFKYIKSSDSQHRSIDCDVRATKKKRTAVSFFKKKGEEKEKRNRQGRPAPHTCFRRASPLITPKFTKIVGDKVLITDSDTLLS
jgi:hypothetical protein